jgi:hypothetical protein
MGSVGFRRLKIGSFHLGNLRIRYEWLAMRGDIDAAAVLNAQVRI